MTRKIMFFLMLILATLNLFGQGKLDRNKTPFTQLKQTINQIIETTGQAEVVLNNGTKQKGYLIEIKDGGFILLNRENGTANYFLYSQIKQIKPASKVANFSKVLKNPSLKIYWDNFFARNLNESAVGYVYAIYQNESPLAVGVYGYNKFPQFPKDSGILMSPQTRIQLASVSKPITAIALLHAMEKKGISPDTKFWTLLKAHFPDLTAPGKGVEDITIAQLLTHTSGYPFGYVQSPRIENLRELLAKPVPNPSGKDSVYSNINFSIARTLIEIITGKDYEKYVKEEIFRPAGVEKMSLQINENEASLAYQFGEFTGAPLAIDFRDGGGAYGWYATAEEVVKVFGLVRSNKYLSPEMTKAMFERKLGWGTSETRAGTAYRHDGQWVIAENRGERTAIVLLPDNIVATLLINTDSKMSPGELLVRGFNENLPRIYSSNLDKSTKLIRVEIPLQTDEVRCTTNNTMPNNKSPLYFRPIQVQIPATIKCQGFLAGNPITFVNTLQIS